MAPQTRRSIAVGVVTTVLGVIVVGIITAAKQSVVPRGEYDLHTQSVINWQTNHSQADSARWREMLTEQRAQGARLDEVLCELRPNRRGC